MEYIKLSEENCKSCYKCINSCVVKAIKMVNEQAEIEYNRCINCGRCIAVCPQGARTIKKEVNLIKQALYSGKKLIASIAPSFPGYFNYKHSGQVVTALKQLGFEIVEETSIGAEIVTNYYKDALNIGNYENFITTSCPSVNNLIEKYFPSLLEYMAPVVSPMIAHGKLLKKIYGDDCFIVFIGPCVSKKYEAKNSREIIDAVITYNELSEWLDFEKILLEELTPEKFDRVSSKKSSSYPIVGGILETLDSSIKEKYDLIRVDGVEECMGVFKSLENGFINNVCIEASICKGSCIAGPSSPSDMESFFKKQHKVKEYIKTKAEYTPIKINAYNNIDFSATFQNKKIKRQIPSEEEIKEIFKKMGKYSPADELNCGGCGYNTCREKAQAVFEGMSDAEICLPYLRRQAENLKNVIFEHSPNILIILDYDLQIIELNPTGEKFFDASATSMKNKPISELIDDELFRDIKTNYQKTISKKIMHYKDKVMIVETIMYVEKENIFISIMKDITDTVNNKLRVNSVMEKTLDSAQKVIEKQMRVAQEIASLLGETTAETRVILTKLEDIAKEELGDIENEILY